MCRFHTHDYTHEKLLAYSDNVEELYPIRARGISNDFFRNHYDPRGSLVLSGRDSIGEDEILIARQLAERIFGEKDPIGRTLTLLNDTLSNDGSRKEKFYSGKSYRIAGVCENIYTNGHQWQIYVPMHDKGECAMVYGYLKDGYSVNEVRKAIDEVEWRSADDGKPYDMIAIQQNYDRDFWLSVVFLVLFSLLIFATGLINFMKFVIQMFYSRQRELALRKCLGSNNRGLYMLLASEVFIMLTMSFFLSCITSELSVMYLDYLNVDIFDDIPMRMIIPVQLHTAIMAFIVSLVAIFLPIMKLRRASMRGALMRRRQGNKMRNFMIGLQFAVAIISFSFLALALQTEKAECGRHEEQLSEEELERILVISNLQHNWEQIRPLLEKLPIVEEFTYTCHENMRKSALISQKLYVNNDSIYADLIAYGDPSYFKFFKLPVDGKIVPPDANYVYIDRKLHQALLAGGTYDGTVEMGNGLKYPVAGVIDKVLTRDWNNVYGSIFFVSPQGHTFYYRIKDGVSMKEAHKAFEKEFYKFVPKTFEIEIPTLKEINDDLNTFNRMMKHMAYIMAFISLLVVVLSIYSTISLDATTKQKEIAIRKINGARKGDILRRFVVPYATAYSVTFLIVYPLLACFYVSVTNGYGRVISTGMIFAIGAMIYFGIMALIAVVTWHKIKMIMGINPAEVIRRE
ncbi:MAG: FtsX-like permease family protein [Bacteroidaceae bacterium]|nr:FtsX-like permease family protein [Bacteroidaceae bacterium]